MGMKYSYDEEGLTFYFFLLTLTCLYVLPTTYRLIWPSSYDRFQDSVKCTCGDCVEKKSKKAFLKKTYRNKFGWVKHLILVVGWIFVGLSLFSIITKSRGAKLYDPFEVLGVTTGADEKTIKKAYKKLSLKWHPDKAKDDESREDSRLRFIEINKAYKTLTDEVSRRNWEEHGNPDGPTTFSLGIALPSWLVESHNAAWVLALYGLGFGILIPWLVSRSWNQSKKYTKDNILQETMVVFYKLARAQMSIKDVFELLCAAKEFYPENEFRWQTEFGDGPTERLIELLSDVSLSGEKFKRPEMMKGISLRVYCLLFAHVHRVALPDENWRADQTLIVAKAVHLCTGILKIALVREWPATSLNAITVGQFLVQGCWEKDLPLIQLPYMTPEFLETYQKNKANKVSIRELLEMEEEKRTSAMKPLELTAQQTEGMLKVARAFPDINVLNVDFKILGQEEITPDGVITCLIKLKLNRMEDAMKLDLKKESERARKENVDVEQFEFDEDGNMVESSKKLSETVDPVIALQPIHAPFFPMDRKPSWWIILLNQRMDTFICPPQLVRDLAGERVITMQFPSPSRTGQINLRLLIRSDCLYGADILMDAKFTIVKESKTNTIVDSDWEISDSESDGGSPFGAE